MKFPGFPYHPVNVLRGKQPPRKVFPYRTGMLPERGALKLCPGCCMGRERPWSSTLTSWLARTSQCTNPAACSSCRPRTAHSATNASSAGLPAAPYPSPPPGGAANVGAGFARWELPAVPAVQTLEPAPDGRWFVAILRIQNRPQRVRGRSRPALLDAMNSGSRACQTEPVRRAVGPPAGDRARV